MDAPEPHLLQPHRSTGPLGRLTCLMPPWCFAEAGRNDTQGQGRSELTDAQPVRCGRCVQPTAGARPFYSRRARSGAHRRLPEPLHDQGMDRKIILAD
eukprot:4708409-Alexandrium_andersonii.AAC.1